MAELAISRRAFIKGALLAGGAAVLACGVPVQAHAATFVQTDTGASTMAPLMVFFSGHKVEYLLHDDLAYKTYESGTYDGIRGQSFRVVATQGGSQTLSMTHSMSSGEWDRLGMTVHGVGYLDASGTTQPDVLCKSTKYATFTNTSRSDHNVGREQYFGEIEWWPRIVVAYDANSASPTTGLPAEQEKLMGHSLSISASCPKRADALFRHWSLDAAGTKPIAPGQRIGWHDWNTAKAPIVDHGWNDSEYTAQRFGETGTPPVLCPNGTSSNRVTLYAQWSRPSAPTLSQAFR